MDKRARPYLCGILLSKRRVKTDEPVCQRRVATRSITTRKLNLKAFRGKRTESNCDHSRSDTFD